MKRILLLAFVVLLVGCAEKSLSQFQVQRPAKISLPANAKMIFIDPDLIQTTNDDLGIKDQVLTELAKKLNSYGRFKAVVGKPVGVDGNRESFAIVQGSILSKEEVDVGQFTEIANCEGGFAGLAAAAGGAKDRGITRSRRGLPCRTDTLSGQAAAAGVSALMAMAGSKSIPPKDQVVRVYKYKNITLYAQLDLSLTLIGEDRKQVALRSDAASYSQHKLHKAVNVHESFLSFREAMVLFFSPVVSLKKEEHAIVNGSNPGHILGALYKMVTPNSKDLSAKEQKKIVTRLVNRAVTPFLQTISPYPALIRAEVAEGGSVAVSGQMKDGKFAQAKKRLEAANSNNPADLYNLGLCIEATAINDGDYIQAQENYSQALNQDPSNLTFAQGVGRMEKRLKEANLLKKQKKGES